MGKYCSNCGKERENKESKFCKHCGCPFETTTGENLSQQPTQEPKVDQLVKEKVSQNIASMKKQAGKMKEDIQQSEWKNKATEKLDLINRQPEKKKKILKICSVIVLVVFLLIGWRWVSTKDYRHAMANGDNYFKQGEFGQATEFYQQAQEEKPGNESAIQMTDYARDLGNYWTQINEDQFSGSRSQAIDEVERKLDKIKNKKVKEKYNEVINTIKNSDQYQLEERIGNKYKDAYDIE